MTDTDKPLYRITAMRKNHEVMDEWYSYDPARGLSNAQGKYGEDYLYIVEPYVEAELPYESSGKWVTGIIP